MSDVVCHVCDRVELDGGDVCAKCRYPLRDIVPDFKVYGCEVMIEAGVCMGRTERIELAYKGDVTTARRRAKMARNFIRVLAVRPLPEARYIATYGEGRM